VARIGADCQVGERLEKLRERYSTALEIEMVDIVDLASMGVIAVMSSEIGSITNCFGFWELYSSPEAP
jgi:hypothetical protein